MKRKKTTKLLLALAIIAAMQMPVCAQASSNVDTPDASVVHFEFMAEHTLCFDASMLEKHLHLEGGELSAARVCVVPQNGRLMVDGVSVESGEILLRSQLDSLCYVPLSASSSDWFALTPVSGSSVSTAICLSPIHEEKQAPKLQNGHCVTAKNMSVRRMAKTDSGVGLLVLHPAKKGYVRLEGTTYTYTPYRNASGRDSFSLAAFDEGGRLSKEAVITVDIERGPDGNHFEDMRGNPSEYAAMQLKEHGILSGECIGGTFLFHPNKIVTVGEFLVMTQDAINNGTPLPVCVNTGLQNDDQIPFWMKSYVRTAHKQGLIFGNSIDLDAPITQEEGIRMIEQCTKISDTPFDPLSQEILSCFEAANETESPRAAATQSSPLTRAQAADLLLALIRK